MDAALEVLGLEVRSACSSGSVTLTIDGATAHGTPYSWLELHQIDGGDHEAADLIDHDGDGMLAWEVQVSHDGAGTLSFSFPDGPIPMPVSRIKWSRHRISARDPGAT